MSAHKDESLQAMADTGWPAAPDPVMPRPAPRCTREAEQQASDPLTVEAWAPVWSTCDRGRFYRLFDSPKDAAAAKMADSRITHIVHLVDEHRACDAEHERALQAEAERDTALEVIAGMERDHGDSKQRRLARVREALQSLLGALADAPDSDDEDIADAIDHARSVLASLDVPAVKDAMEGRR